MPRKTTPSFITEIPLIVTSEDEKELKARFKAGMRILNACLNEAEVRMKLVQSSKAFKKALNLPRNSPERRKAFELARANYRFTEFALHAYATLTSTKSKWIAEKLDSNTQQKLATRAFRAVERVLLGKAKKIRFKVPSRFRSMEGKSNKQGMRWKDGCLVWGKLRLKPLIESNNRSLLHGLNSPIKYVRLIRRELGGRTRWYAQLVNEGYPYQKPQNYVADGIIGLDLNVSHIAFVGDKRAGLLPFAHGVPSYEKQIRLLQRRMERSRRAANPNNYHPDFPAQRGRKQVVKKGKIKKGVIGWNKSNNYNKTAAKKRDKERKKTAYAKAVNRQTVNEILRHGKHIKTENVSVKGWQKRYGKAIAAKSPGFVQLELCRKAESAGGTITKFSCQKTALSQTHLTGERIKKSLSERIHYDQTGIVMHRDLFSAFLARHVSQDTLSLQDGNFEYPGAEPFLEEAWKQHQQTAKRVGSPESPQSDSPAERFSQKLGKMSQIVTYEKVGRKAHPKSDAESPGF